MTDATFEDNLATEARLFATRLATAPSDAVRTYIIADFEYAWDRDAHAAYFGADREGAEPSIRWPFHKVAAAAWIVMRFEPGASIPSIGDPVVLAGEDTDERMIVASLFAAMAKEEAAVFVTWGGEAKDLAVLRRAAGDHGLVLPRALRDPSPYASARLDLCLASAVRAAPVHLAELSAASSIPAKPNPAKSIGKLVESRAWPAVREQVLADVVTTTLLSIRYLVSHGYVACDQPRSAMMLADRAHAALPASRFFELTFKTWARGRVAAASLRGTVYRAA